ncbi:hypothetical protein SMICM304S_03603 [Streptomyces microflavus]
MTSAARRAAAASGSGRSPAARNSASIRSGPGGRALGGAGGTAGSAPAAPAGSARAAVSTAAVAGPILSVPSTAPGTLAPRSTEAAAVSAIQAPSTAPPSGSSRPRPSRCRTAAVHPSALCGLCSVVIAPACRIHGAGPGKRT